MDFPKAVREKDLASLMLLALVLRASLINSLSCKGLDMTSIVLLAALTALSQNDPSIDGKTLFAVFEKYHSAFHDITFLYDVRFSKADKVGDKELDPGSVRTMQGLYAYRSDGATLRDDFAMGTGVRPIGRTITCILHNRMEGMDASPDLLPAVRDRIPETGPGGPGVLAGPCSPERIFLAYYYPTLGDPAEHEIEFQGWEDVDSHRCLKVRMLQQARPLLKGWVGGLHFIKLWVDLKRDGCPLRYELYRGDDLEVRSEISRLEHLPLPGGRAFWLPVAGKTVTFLGQLGPGQIVHTKEPYTLEEIRILAESVKFDQGLGDSFFSVKKQALVASDEDLRKLQRQLEEAPKPEVKRQPAAPES